MNLIIYLLSAITFILFIISIIILINNKQCTDTFFNNNKSLEKFAIANNATELLELPLSEFYISTSHNSYLGKLQVLGAANPSHLLNVLRDGARCIELDVHSSMTTLSINLSKIINNLMNIPVVSHKALDTDIFPLVDYLTIIKNNAFISTNDPLFLYLEISDMDKEQFVKRLAFNIENILGPLLYEGRMAYYDNNGKYIRDIRQEEYFLNVPIKKLLGKICIIINYFNMNIGKGLEYRNKYLFPLVHGTTDEPRNDTSTNPKQLGDSGTGWFNNYPKSNLIFGKGNSEDIIEKIKMKNLIGRVYPENTILSSNYNSLPFFNANYTFIAMNYSFRNFEFLNYLYLFNTLNVLPTNYLISTDNKLIKPSVYYVGDYVEFRNNSTNFPILKAGTIYSNFSWNNGDYTLTMQGDGNLVLYRNYTNKPRKAIWSTGTSKNPDSTLWCQYDGNIVIYNKDYKAIWSTNTYKSTDKNSYCHLTSYGDFILYNANGDKRKTIN